MCFLFADPQTYGSCANNRIIACTDIPGNLGVGDAVGLDLFIVTVMIFFGMFVVLKKDKVASNQ